MEKNLVDDTVAARDNTRAFSESVFANYCFNFSLKKKKAKVKPMSDDDHQEAIIMEPYNRSSRLELRNAWES